MWFSVLIEICRGFSVLGSFQSVFSVFYGPQRPHLPKTNIRQTKTVLNFGFHAMDSGRISGTGFLA